MARGKLVTAAAAGGAFLRPAVDPECGQPSIALLRIADPELPTYVSEEVGHSNTLTIAHPLSGAYPPTNAVEGIEDRFALQHEIFIHRLCSPGAHYYCLSALGRPALMPRYSS